MISPAVASLGDSALLLPASALLALLLAGLRQGRLLAAWILALVVAGGTTLAAKLLLHACGPSLGAPGAVSPSGHASLSVIFYGALAILLGAGRPSLTRWLLGGGAALVVVAVGISRVRTAAHTPAEVLIGITIGAAALALFAILHGRTDRPRIPLAPVAGGFAVALLLLGGAHFSLEHSIGRTARRLANQLDICAAPQPMRTSHHTAGQ
ncbi:phosphatase PAP2 family protein [uncultured Enterovirga sp.]|uniref:phosphatase PAP2 family protein n=1 Tax=uncultured Enterovirga sp. TaxID=2026352 RepID=UPI0035CC67FF